MLLYRFFQAYGMEYDLMKIVIQFPERLQRGLGLIPVRVSNR